MASFINFLQVNQHIAKLTTYGGIAPLAQSKWYIGVADQDPKAQPIDVYIKDTDGNKQILKQPIETDAIGNFIDSTDANKTPLLPQIDKSEYSLLIEVEINGKITIYRWKLITAEKTDDETYQRKDKLVNINTVKPSDDPAHNAPTAESVINKDKYLNDQINNNLTKIEILESGFKFIKSFNTFGIDKLVDISKCTGLIRIIGFGSGGGGGGAEYNLNDIENVIPRPSYGGQSGGVFDIYLNASKLNNFYYNLEPGGKAGDTIPSGNTRGMNGGDLTLKTIGNIIIAIAHGGTGGYPSLINPVLIGVFDQNIRWDGSYFINMSKTNYVSSGTGRIGAYPSQGNIIRQPVKNPSVKTLLSSYGYGGLSKNPTFYDILSVPNYPYGMGGRGSELSKINGLVSGSGVTSGKNGGLIIFSNQEIPD